MWFSIWRVMAALVAGVVSTSCPAFLVGSNCRNLDRSKRFISWTCVKKQLYSLVEVDRLRVALIAFVFVAITAPGAEAETKKYPKKAGVNCIQKETECEGK